MESRVHRIGTIFSRISGLVRKGNIEPQSIPLWYGVYKAFPPKYEPTFKRTTSDIPVKEIFYKEDTLRALIHKTYPDKLSVFYLDDDRELYAEKLLKTCEKFMSEGLSREKAIEELGTTFDQSKVSEECQGEFISVDQLLTKIL